MRKSPFRLIQDLLVHASISLQIFTGIILLIFGAVKQHVTGAKGGFTGYLWGAVSTLCVGGAAAGAAFAIVRALESAE